MGSHFGCCSSPFLEDWKVRVGRWTQSLNGLLLHRRMGRIKICGINEEEEGEGEKVRLMKKKRGEREREEAGPTCNYKIVISLLNY